MTAKGRGAPVCPLGRYYTEDEVARAIVARLELDGVGVILEPSAGGGAFVRALVERRRAEGLTYRILAVDVDAQASARDHLEPEHGDAFAVLDFLDVLAWPEAWPSRVDLAVGNPPYSIRVLVLDEEGQPQRYPEGHKRAGELVDRTIEVATDHALRCLELAARAVLLFREGFAGSVERYARLWARGTLIRQDTLIPRPSFTGGSTDATEYAAFTLDAKGGHRAAKKGWIVWSEGSPTGRRRRG